MSDLTATQALAVDLAKAFGAETFERGNLRASLIGDELGQMFFWFIVASQVCGYAAGTLATTLNVPKEAAHNFVAEYLSSPDGLQKLIATYQQEATDNG